MAYVRQLTKQEIVEYLGTTSFNDCRGISIIHLEHNDNKPNEDIVKAWIPPSSTSRGDYVITIRIHRIVGSILGSHCTCPVSHKCKHIHKVLGRIRRSVRQPLPGPSAAYLSRVAVARKKKQKMKHAKVWIAMTCKSEMDDGDWHYGDQKDEWDHQTLGVFLSGREADNCAKQHVKTVLDPHYDDDYEDMDDEEDDTGGFEWSGDELEIFVDEVRRVYAKVWVEPHAIEDATNRFRK